MTFTFLASGPVVSFKRHEKWQMFLLLKRCLLRDKKSLPPIVMQGVVQSIPTTWLSCPKSLTGMNNTFLWNLKFTGPRKVRGVMLNGTTRKNSQANPEDGTFCNTNWQVSSISHCHSKKKKKRREKVLNRILIWTSKKIRQLNMYGIFRQY